MGWVARVGVAEEQWAELCLGAAAGDLPGPVGQRCRGDVVPGGDVGDGFGGAGEEAARVQDRLGAAAPGVPEGPPDQVAGDLGGGLPGTGAHYGPWCSRRGTGWVRVANSRVMRCTWGVPAAQGQAETAGGASNAIVASNEAFRGRCDRSRTVTTADDRAGR